MIVSSRCTCTYQIMQACFPLFCSHCTFIPPLHCEATVPLGTQAEGGGPRGIGGGDILVTGRLNADRTFPYRKWLADCRTLWATCCLGSVFGFPIMMTSEILIETEGYFKKFMEKMELKVPFLWAQKNILKFLHTRDLQTTQGKCIVWRSYKK